MNGALERESLSRRCQERSQIFHHRGMTHHDCMAATSIVALPSLECKTTRVCLGGKSEGFFTHCTFGGPASGRACIRIRSVVAASPMPTLAHTSEANREACNPGFKYLQIRTLCSLSLIVAARHLCVPGFPQTLNRGFSLATPAFSSPSGARVPFLERVPVCRRVLPPDIFAYPHTLQ